jgi:hypothetical protein
MVLTKSELITALQNEVRILLHLASKIDPSQLDYRPTPKQRTTMELLRYLSVMGPSLVEGVGVGFDQARWKVAADAAAARDFDQTLEAIAAHADTYARLLSAMSDDDLRLPFDGFDGRKTTRGAFIVNLVLCGCAAYRTQLFLYLKACGRDELGTANLWGGMDAPPAAS